ncbi:MULTISPECIES: CDP-glucose 4,6-dehydratase [unclassified Beijerinckia]|uniref:CDP-glucose 4,6-dehydratase n=1 Tax=unclassified Beijerinckia TaxID=2638183 RepID=UPI0008944239|nr:MULTISPECIES: CDP-glucose 4,6-dehydratase [unclassified Beijerinckia]MDH7796122.1 CDP-glucose 4,6-dehydratase [Beijerinckia sp. GAS462]SEC31289.1 CDP-glucose 4,6-dehydratase [Beijerinckia sp. 28-YEA-48]
MMAGEKSVLPDPAFWANKRVLLTGQTGFKGSWAALWLTKLGAKVTGLALPPDTDPALFDLAQVGNDITSVIGDLRDRSMVESVVARVRPQIVLHLAAQPIVRRALAEPVDTIATNVLGTAQVLDALRAVEGLEAVLIVTSDKVYANDDQGLAFGEHDELGGKDPYSASKAAAELITRAFAKSYFEKNGVKVATARGGNVIGGGDYAADRIVPDIVRAAVRGEKLILRMPQATRPWQHVLDCLCGYFVYAQQLVEGHDLPRALNFGPKPGEHLTVGAIADTMLRSLSDDAGWEHVPLDGNIEMATLAVDSSKARQLLGWSDRLTGDRLLEWTTDWYRAISQDADAREITLQQIDRYTDL